ncbi:MAG: hypothetical protein ACK48F_12850, partial [Chryseotalea sp.]
NKDYIQAASSMGIGLAFDPFDSEIKWNNRPSWQKAILFIHLALVATMLGFGIGLKFKPIASMQFRKKFAQYWFCLDLL